ncbi:MAG: hypothetical protein JW797_18615 [Bradymonadales bacterium]|nr:hypothetical protein [Bradymonadales bacterium]
MRHTVLTTVLASMVGLLSAAVANGATVIYDDQLHPGWSSWSWGGEFSFEYTEEVLAGTASISVTIEQYGALSLHSERPFREATGVSFWLKGSGEPLVVFLQAGEGEDTQESDQVAIADLVETTPDDWTLVAASFRSFDALEWNRVNIMSTDEEQVSFLVDEIILQGVDFPGDQPIEEALDPNGDLEEVEDAGDAPDQESDAELSGADAGGGQTETETDDGWGCRVMAEGGTTPRWLMLLFGAILWLIVRRGERP